MKEFPESEKRQLFVDAIRQILAVEFPLLTDDPQKIYLLFHDEEIVKQIVFFLQDYHGTGFSLIIETIDEDRINLKIYEPDTDAFYTCEGISVKTNVLKFYSPEQAVKTFLSVGQLEIVNDNATIHKVAFLKIPVTSIEIRNNLK